MKDFSIKEFVVVSMIILSFILIFSACKGSSNPGEREASKREVSKPGAKKANLLKCTKNLKQIGVAIKMYQIDFGNKVRFPDANGGSFITRLYAVKVLPETKIYICPATSDKTDDEKLKALGSQQGINSGDTDSINATSYCGRKNGNCRTYPGLFRTKRDAAITTIGSDDFNQPKGKKYNHEEKQPFLFLDGHLESKKTSGSNTNKADFSLFMDPLTN